MRVTRSARVREELDRDDSPEVQEVAAWIGGVLAEVAEVAEVEVEEVAAEVENLAAEVEEVVTEVAAEVGRPAQREYAKDSGDGGELRSTTRGRLDGRRAEMNGSDGSGTRRSKQLGKGGANSADASASQQPAHVLHRERSSSSPVDLEVDVAARRQAGMVDSEAADVAEEERIARAMMRLSKGKEKVVESSMKYCAESDECIQDWQAAGPSTQPCARERAEREEDAEPADVAEQESLSRARRLSKGKEKVVESSMDYHAEADGYESDECMPRLQVQHFMTYASI
ncbi:unnamed protein product [Closterium sp. Yama58-4]|nr:unnamed protein product [Closterium sp. Yama58-4]